MFLCQRELVSLGVSGTFLDPGWKNSASLPGRPDLEAKICHFLQTSPNGVWPSNCLKIYPVAACFLLTELAWLPALGFLEAVGGPTTPQLWPIGVARYRPGDPSMAPSVLKHTLTAWIPPGQYYSDLGICLQSKKVQGDIWPLTLELRPSVQVWRSDIWEVKHLLQIEAWKQNLCGCLSFFQGR